MGPRIEQAFNRAPDVHVLLFEPAGAPSPSAMARDRKPPSMTQGRALLLGLMRRYLAAVMDPTVTLLEIHKLMYFTQEAGQQLRLNYSKGLYGPYADNLRHVLSRIEGHFVVGYGDGSDTPDKPIELMKPAAAEAERFLRDHSVIRRRLDQVADLIGGFETPYGMELLSTVHWVAVREGAATAEEAEKLTYAWNERKGMFRRDHIRIAWQVLERKGWLAHVQSDSGR